MLILNVTDIHGNRKVVRELYREYGIDYFDLVIVNGDITDFHGIDLAELILSMLSRLGKETLFVPGNCDHPKLLEIDSLGGAKNIHNQIMRLQEHKDLTIYGYGGSTLTPFNTWIEFPDKKIAEDTEHIQKPHIVVAHTPPYNTKIDKTWMGRHVGSKSIREFILREKPLLSLHGHIHEARGMDNLGSTIVVNPGPLRNRYYSIIKLKNDLSIDKVELLQLKKD